MVELLVDGQRNTMRYYLSVTRLEQIPGRVGYSDSQIRWLALSEGSPTVLTPQEGPLARCIEERSPGRRSAHSSRLGKL